MHRAEPSLFKRRGSTLATVLVTVAVTAAGIAWLAASNWLVASTKRLHTTAATKDKLLFRITARGQLACQIETRLQCNVYSLGRDSGTQLLYLIPNGSEVRKGDLLATLDSSIVQERLDYYILRQIERKSRQIQAHARLENQKLRNATQLAEARQTIRHAELSLRAYQQSTHATTRLTLQTDIDDARSAARLAKAELQFELHKLNGINTLFESGYRTQTHVDLNELEVLRAKNTLEKAQRSLDSKLNKLAHYDRYEHPLTLKRLQFALQMARADLRRIEVECDTQLVERQADLAEQDANVAGYEDRISTYTEQVNNCTIQAPHDGFAVYADDDIYEGASVNWRESLLVLPNTQRMGIKSRVNQSDYRHIQPGLHALVRVEAYPERVYPGTIQSVSAVSSPIKSYHDDVQVFDVNVSIDETVDDLLPGMTGIVELILETDEVIQVPLQAVSDEENQTYVYVNSSTGPERRDIAIGENNDYMVEVRNGLEVGEQVVIAPEVPE